jgi:hypothetical protein
MCGPRLARGWPCPPFVSQAIHCARSACGNRDRRTGQHASDEDDAESAELFHRRDLGKVVQGELLSKRGKKVGAQSVLRTRSTILNAQPDGSRNGRTLARSSCVAAIGGAAIADRCANQCVSSRRNLRRATRANDQPVVQRAATVVRTSVGRWSAALNTSGWRAVAPTSRIVPTLANVAFAGLWKLSRIACTMRKTGGRTFSYIG